MALEEGVSGGLFALAIGLVVFVVALMIALYVYMSLAFVKIAKKAKLSSPGIAWIPGFGPTIIAFRKAKMHWWPWLLLIGLIIPVVGFIPLIVFCVFATIWTWKLFEAIKKPGWWAILMLIPVVNLIMIGIIAWGK